MTSNSISKLLIKCETRIKIFSDKRGLRKLISNPQFFSKLPEHVLWQKEAVHHKQEAIRFNKQ